MRRSLFGIDLTFVVYHLVCRKSDRLISLVWLAGRLSEQDRGKIAPRTSAIGACASPAVYVSEDGRDVDDRQAEARKNQ